MILKLKTVIVYFGSLSSSYLQTQWTDISEPKQDERLCGFIQTVSGCRDLSGQTSW